MTSTDTPRQIWLCGKQYPRCESTFGGSLCAHEAGHDGKHHSGHRYWVTSEQDDLSPEGTDLYGTRAIPQNGQPVHDRCGQPLRWSTSYDEPHWVHTSAAAVVACPPVRGSL